ncbi:MAG: carboxypeptidase regulatory-like domain-containing protein, partial [Nannocystaceae bacterium]
DFISGARLRVDGRGARTDSKGGARFVHLPPGPALLEVSAVGYVTARETLRGDEDEVVERLVELVEGGRIEGQVRDDLGDAVGNVTVEVFRPGGREVLGLAKTDARGRFQVDSLPVGEIEVIARVPAGGQELWVDARLASDVLGGQVTRDVFLRFDRRAPQN